MQKKRNFVGIAIFCLSLCLITLAACSSSYSVSENKSENTNEENSDAESNSALTSMILTKDGKATVYKFGYTDHNLTSVDVDDTNYTIGWESGLPTSCGDTPITTKQDPINGAIILKYGETRYEFVPKRSDNLSALSYFSILHTDDQGQNLTDKYKTDTTGFVTEIDKNISRTQTSDGTAEETISFGFTEDARTHKETLTVYSPQGNAEYSVTKDEAGRIVTLDGTSCVVTFAWDDKNEVSPLSSTLVNSTVDTILGNILVPTGA